MRTTLFSFAALTCSCANAFTTVPSLRSVRGPAGARSASCVTMAGSLREEDFVPSERWLGEYMGQQGLRYALNKTPDEIKKEGDYSLFEKLFGQTSNNEARMQLKEQIKKKVNTPTDPKLYKEWTTKYGYGRFFPAYIDKSGYSNDDAPATPAAKVESKPPAAVSAFKSVLPSKPKVTAAPKAAPKASGRPSAVAVAKPAAKPAPKAAPKAAPKPKPVAKVDPPKSKGNIKNLPKAL